MKKLCGHSGNGPGQSLGPADDEHTACEHPAKPDKCLIRVLSSDDLREYLSSVSNDFNPAAKTLLGIPGYADKLTQLGITIAATSDSSGMEGVLGILAGYFNNPGQGFSFVSAFHVRRPFRRMHIGKMLMDKAVEISINSGFKMLRLRVDKDNGAGIGFYERYGFIKIGETENQFEMSFDLGPVAMADCKESGKIGERKTFS